MKIFAYILALIAVACIFSALFLGAKHQLFLGIPTAVLSVISFNDKRIKS